MISQCKNETNQTKPEPWFWCVHAAKLRASEQGNLGFPFTLSGLHFLIDKTKRLKQLIWKFPCIFNTLWVSLWVPQLHFAELGLKTAHFVNVPGSMGKLMSPPAHWAAEYLFRCKIPEVNIFPLGRICFWCNFLVLMSFLAASLAFIFMMLYQQRINQQFSPGMVLP